MSTMPGPASSSSNRGRTDVPRIWQPDLVEVPVLRKDGHSTASYLHESALDTTDSASVSSLEVASLRIPPGFDQMRRRGSDLSRARPTACTLLRPESRHEAIELQSINPVKQNAVDHAAITIEDFSPVGRIRDAEIGPRIPDSEVVSMQIGHETNPSAPVISAEQKTLYKWRGRLHFAALCWSFFLEGWNDGSTGPLLPTIQKHYNIGFAIVSLLFVLNCVGFLSAAVMNVYLTDKFGFGKIVVLGAILQFLAYVIMSPAGPFPLMCTAFCFSGFGISLQNAQGNGFVGSIKEHASTKLNFLHASYGLGAFAAPLVATQFSTQAHWSYHYLISAAIGVSNVVFLAWVFKGKKQDDIMAEAGQAPAETDSASGSKYRQIMRLSAVHFLACWTLIYVGVEVTLGGWIVTFIEQKRGGTASAGYISSGFFGGLMLGRLTLMWLTRKIGERRVMFIYAFLAIQLEVTVWVVPSLIENALAVSFIGLLLGPMYPILVRHTRDSIPKWLFTGGVGWIGGVGQAGSAILPFLTGLLASKFGIGSLQPFIVSMMSTMVVLWAFIPRVRRVD